MKSLHSFLSKNHYYKFGSDTFQVQIEFDFYCVLLFIAVIATSILVFSQ